MNTAIKIILAVLFLLCLLHMPYGYYQLVRFLAMVGFGFLAYVEYRESKSINGWAIVWLCSAVLINPVVKIALGRTLWNVVDVIWAVLLIISIVQHERDK